MKRLIGLVTVLALVSLVVVFGFGATTPLFVAEDPVGGRLRPWDVRIPHPRGLRGAGRV